MRVETIPLIFGSLVGLAGLAIVADALLPEEMSFGRNRRRQERTERSTAGEACIGVAVLCMAAALLGRDSWPYETVSVMAGSALFLLGVALNWAFLRERIVNRGSLRRGGLRAGELPKPPKPPVRDRIR